MSRGGRQGFSLRIEKSYWLFDTENKSYKMDCGCKKQKKECRPMERVSRKETSNSANSNRYETDSQSKRRERKVRPLKRTNKIELNNYQETDSDRKRKGSQINGPPNKKIRKDNAISNEDNNDSDQSVPQLHVNKSKKSPISVLGRQPQIVSSPNMNSSINSELFDDVESMGAEYDGELAFIGTLFNDIENVPSDITEVSSNENNFFIDILNIFDNVDQDDENDEDRVIITEIFDDDEAQPEKPLPNKPLN